MIINESKFGEIFDTEDFTFTIDGEEVEYSEMVATVKSGKKFKRLEMSSDELRLYFEDEPCDLGVSVFINYNKDGYSILSDICGDIPDDSFYSDYAEQDDFEEISKKLFDQFEREGYYVPEEDYTLDYGGDYSQMYGKQFATAEEALSKIPEAMTNILNIVEMKARYLVAIREYYENKD